MSSALSECQPKMQIIVNAMRRSALIGTTVILSSIVLVSSCSTTPQISPRVIADLAPTGKVRAGINVRDEVMTAKDPATGEPRGIAVDLARELARRLGVPLEIVPFAGSKLMADSVNRGDWDVAFLAVEPERATEISYSAPYVEIEATYLVPPGSLLRTVEDVDRKGVRVAISEWRASGRNLSGNLKQAQLVKAPVGTPAFKLFVDENLDAYSNQRPVLLDVAVKLPGSRILDGYFSKVGQAVGTPSSREVGAKYVREFVEDIKATGLVAQMIDRNGIRGLAVAPKAKID